MRESIWNAVNWCLCHQSILDWRTRVSKVCIVDAVRLTKTYLPYVYSMYVELVQYGTCLSATVFVKWGELVFLPPMGNLKRISLLPKFLLNYVIISTEYLLWGCTNCGICTNIVTFVIRFLNCYDKYRRFHNCYDKYRRFHNCYDKYRIFMKYLRNSYVIVTIYLRNYDDIYRKHAIYIVSSLHKYR